MEKTDIELIPGFTVLQHTPSSTTLTVPTGHTLRVKRIGPYMFEGVIKDELEDPGPFKITVKLLEKIQPPGVDQEILYEPPRDESGKIQEPDKEQFERAWMNFQQWKMHELKRQNIAIKRGSIRFDFALLNCVDILNGPNMPEDEDWFKRIEDRVNPPKNYGDRLLLFYKTQVIITNTTREVIDKLLFAEEVTMEGLLKAFDSFRRTMAGGASV